ncbi:Nucleoside-diphosphate-sugar epimerase [Streptomyces sp. cf386]|uniref:NAD-dependent epimerase/dehydratase family protein n=1 Tax=Streptomyces sp. cf386 TaxID=1761904 RepID=UPI0008893DF5|nr:NAD(P)-dependent oxidoreductase [Streptomyces sp. cf386]SDP01653.1 Nucleoside-diphosphate-sugar epimerase [Streptomyces sp. cf386]
MGRSVVVLGGTGYLGRHIRTAFEAAGERVVTVARGPAADIRADLARAGVGEIRALLGDLAPDVVVNAAGAVWRTTPEAMAAANDALVTALVEAVVGPAPGTRLVQLGTVHEYGPGVRPRATPEVTPPQPVTPYGRTKLSATQRVLAAVADQGLDAVVLRIANVSGPGAPEGSLLGSVAARLAAGRRAGGGPVELRLAPLSAHRDYVDVRDVAAAVLAAADARLPAAQAGRVVNIGRGEAVAVRDLVERLVTASGVPARIVESPPPTASDRTPPEWQCLDISRARALLAWHPRYDLDASLRDQFASLR